MFSAALIVRMREGEESRSEERERFSADKELALIPLRDFPSMEKKKKEAIEPRAESPFISSASIVTPSVRG